MFRPSGRIRGAAILLCPLALAACGDEPVVASSPSAGSAPQGTSTLAAAPGADTPEGPYVLVLGTAQDAGLPQIGCQGACCEAARKDPARRRLVTSLLVADPRRGQRWLFDCTPDLREQVERAEGHPPGRNPPGARPPLFEGIFLTHAHIGHYTGLMFLGPESYGAMAMPVYGTERMHSFLGSNGPWDLMVQRGMLRLEPIAEDRPRELGDGLSVETFAVPHRDEYTDTCAFVIRGPRRSLVYLPDIDKWERWERPIEEVLADVDLALLDGCFFADGEIPGRSMKEIPHPFIQESMQRFAALPASERDKVWFTHLNHTNSAADPGGEAAAAVRAAGMHVLGDGQVFEL